MIKNLADPKIDIDEEKNRITVQFPNKRALITQVATPIDISRALEDRKSENEPIASISGMRRPRIVSIEDPSLPPFPQNHPRQ